MDAHTPSKKQRVSDRIEQLASLFSAPTNSPEEFVNKVRKLRTVMQEKTEEQERLENEARWKKRKLAHKNNQKLRNEWIAIADEGKGRKWTLSIAVPGSLLNNATSPIMRTYIAGQVARAAAIHCVDEIVVYDDGAMESQIESPFMDRRSQNNVAYLTKLLEYCECPQYLRDSFYGLDEDLKWVGVLNPLDTPNHPRATEKCLFREGIAAQHPKSPLLIWANIGLDKVTEVDEKLVGARTNKRLTFMNCGGKLFNDDEVPKVFNVPRHLPRTLTGIYWGYEVRAASSFSAVFSQSPHDEGYDLLIGIASGSGDGQSLDQTSFPSFEHAIIVFGGVRSIDQVLKQDDKLEVKNPLDLFDAYVNPFPSLSLDTCRIRTEESLLINLSVLRPKLISALPSPSPHSS